MQLTAKSVPGTAVQVMRCDKLIKSRTIAERNRAFSEVTVRFAIVVSIMNGPHMVLLQNVPRAQQSSRNLES